LFANGFAFMKRIVAMLCVAQALALSAQAAVAALDEVHHVLGQAHAASALAGPVIGHFGGDDDHHRDHPSHPADHRESVDEGQSSSHHHAGDGMLTPWLGVASVDVTRTVTVAGMPPPVHSIPYAGFFERHDRPPKRLLEII
jgi:ABC-type Zn2+ transport system substrate-binding protein/surface adhesin